MAETVAMRSITFLCLLIVFVTPTLCNAGDDQRTSESPRIVNIINFIRQCEPRIDRITEDVLYETVVSQIEIMKKHDVKGNLSPSNTMLSWIPGTQHC